MSTTSAKMKTFHVKQIQFTRTMLISCAFTLSEFDAFFFLRYALLRVLRCLEQNRENIWGWKLTAHCNRSNERADELIEIYTKEGWKFWRFFYGNQKAWIFGAEDTKQVKTFFSFMNSKPRYVQHGWNWLSSFEFDASTAIACSDMPYK